MAVEVVGAVAVRPVDVLGAQGLLEHFDAWRLVFRVRDDEVRVVPAQQVVRLDAVVPVIEDDEVEALAVLVVRVPDVQLVEVALIVVDGRQVLTAAPLPVTAEHVDPLVLQERKRRDCDVVGLAVPTLQQLKPARLVLRQHVEVFAVHERTDGHVPEHSPDAGLEVEVQRTVEHRLHAKDVALHQPLKPGILGPDEALDVGHVGVELAHFCFFSFFSASFSSAIRAAASLFSLRFIFSFFLPYMTAPTTSLG